MCRVLHLTATSTLSQPVYDAMLIKWKHLSFHLHNTLCEPFANSLATSIITCKIKKALKKNNFKEMALRVEKQLMVYLSTRAITAAEALKYVSIRVRCFFQNIQENLYLVHSLSKQVYRDLNNEHMTMGWHVMGGSVCVFVGGMGCHGYGSDQKRHQVTN